MARLTKTTVTKHRRGFFGRIWQIVFWLFQLTMIASVYANFQAADIATTDCVGPGCDAGVVVASGLLAIGGWFVWLLGTFILGLLMFATRGTLVTYDVER